MYNCQEEAISNKKFARIPNQYSFSDSVYCNIYCKFEDTGTMSFDTSRDPHDRKIKRTEKALAAECERLFLLRCEETCEFAKSMKEGKIPAHWYAECKKARAKVKSIERIINDEKDELEGDE